MMPNSKTKVGFLNPLKRGFSIFVLKYYNPT